MPTWLLTGPKGSVLGIPPCSGAPPTARIVAPSGVTATPLGEFISPTTWPAGSARRPVGSDTGAAAAGAAHASTAMVQSPLHPMARMVADRAHACVDRP